MAPSRICVMAGDGVGPEVTAEARRVLDFVAERRGHQLDFFEEPVGGNCIDQHGVALLPESLRRAKRSAAVLFGAVGGPKWDDPTAPTRPEDGLLAIRKGLGVYANLRPVKVYAPLAENSPLKSPDLKSTDFVVIRELDRRTVLREAEARVGFAQRSASGGHLRVQRGGSRARVTGGLCPRARAALQTGIRGQSERDGDRAGCGARSRHAWPTSIPTSRSSTCSPTPARCGSCFARRTSTSS